jgi:DNA-binding transcriptional LysR family regulator
MRHLRIYRAIRLVRREGSIRKAAERLSVSPSALNRSIQGFEEEIGLAVFDRVPGGVRLTSAGELLMTLVERHLLEFDDLQGLLGALRDGAAGVLRVSLGSDIAAGLPLSVLAAFGADWPGISVEIIVDDGLAALRGHEADIAILTNPVTDDSVEVLYARSLQLAAYCAALQDGTPIGRDLEALVARRLVLPPPGTGSRVAISHFLRRRRLRERVVTSAPAGLLASDLIGEPSTCIFAETVFRQNPALPALTAVPLDLGTVQIMVLRAARMPLSRPAQAFLVELQRTLEAIAQGAEPGARG